MLAIGLLTFLGEDIYMALAKSHYSPDRTAAMDTFFSTGLTPHLDALARLLTGETFTGRLLAGDLATFVIFDILVCFVRLHSPVSFATSP